ncbi:MAG: CRISP-associated protein Cas1 [Fusobacteriaceae bacterium]|jgi:CRISPR-associated protein Cas1|nr:CRISP-associated protein Cas1 [Fusobacteriaceae bacterium]
MGNETKYIFSNGKLFRKDNNLYFQPIGKEKISLKIEVIRDIYIFGEVNFNTKLLIFLGQVGIALHIFNYYGFYTGTYYPRESKVSGKLLVNQVLNYEDNNKRIEIAKEFINSAVHNIHRNLVYYKNRERDLENEIIKIDNLRNEIENCKTIQELMGIEGNIRERYYSSFNKIINQEIDFEKRVKRPPDNMINTMISFTNTLVYTACLSEIYKTQLNPTISYLHEPGTRRFSLSLDIAEIFKPIIADRIIFSMLNKNQITEKDFIKESNYYYMKDKAKMRIVQEFDKVMQNTIKHKELKRNVSYRYLMRLEGYKLIKHLMEDEKYIGFKMWW